jgi:hypothetical protein
MNKGFNIHPVLAQINELKLPSSLVGGFCRFMFFQSIYVFLSLGSNCNFRANDLIYIQSRKL